ncbi:ATP-binding cassette domain-containing protein [Brachybacterium epidermidis]|uniref:ATP-binding cassette domain-containing protein n=1 Tax=Brachybacterium epidermidis TaxID=2781983 RepID=UPI00202B5C0A|nr:ATP-binding cassette domain-containing protein [Brachybacterium epidermidis]
MSPTSTSTLSGCSSRTPCGPTSRCSLRAARSRGAGAGGGGAGGVGLEELAERDGRSLSGGQQRRATIGIGLAMRPSLLLLDEPTSSLDVRSRDDVIGMLDSLADTVRCAVVASHDMELVATWASRVIVLDQGRVLADVTPRELFARPEITRQARLVPPQAARIAHSLGIDPLPLTAAELGEHLRDQQPALMIGGQR